MKLHFLFGRVSYYNLVRKISLASPSQRRIVQDHLFDLTRLVKLGYLRASPRVCQILLSKSCDLSTPKRFGKLKKEPLSKSLLFLTCQIEKRSPTIYISPRTQLTLPVFRVKDAAAGLFIVHVAAELPQPANKFSQPAISSSLPAISSTQPFIFVFQIGQQIFPASCRSLKAFLIHQPPARNHAFQEIPCTERIG